MSEEAGREWVVGTLRSVMAKRRVTYAELVRRLAERGIQENERALRNKVVRGTFGAVFFIQCLEAIGLDSLKLDMTAIMSKPESEREFASEVPRAFKQRDAEELDRVLSDIRALIGAEPGEFERREADAKAELLAWAAQVAAEEEALERQKL